MDALAETWSRSGRKSSDLYKGNTDEITHQLKTWVSERQALNAAIIDLLWDLFATNDMIAEMPEQDEVIRIAFEAKQLKNVERVKEYKEKRDAQTLLAEFLLATLSHQKLEWEELPSILGWTETDAEVCSFLKTRDRTFDAEQQLQILDNGEKLSHWHREYARREMNEDGGYMLVTNNPEPVFRRRHPITVPVDVSGLLPPLPPPYNLNRPHSTDSSPRTLSPDPIDRVESPNETNESAEAIARRIENMSIAGKPVKTEKLSKAKIRDIRRKKAKERAKEAEDAPGDDVGEGNPRDAPGDDVGEGGSREQFP